MENYPATVPSASIKEAMNSLEFIRTLLEPYLVELTAEDYKAMPYVSVDSLKSALDFALANGEHVPPTVNDSELKTTAKAMDELWQLEQHLEQVAQCLSETILLTYSKRHPWLLEVEKQGRLKMSAWAHSL